MIELPFYVAIPLAGWWLADLLANDYGPFGIFEMLRYLVGAGATSCSEQMLRGISNPFCCSRCLSVWTTGAMILLYAITPGVVSGFALIGITWIVHDVMAGLKA